MKEETREEKLARRVKESRASWKKHDKDIDVHLAAEEAEEYVSPEWDEEPEYIEDDVPLFDTSKETPTFVGYGKTNGDE